MNLQKIISELEAERDRLDQAILALERLSNSQPKRRGRPPRWLRSAGDVPAEIAPVDMNDTGRLSPE